MPIKDDSDRHNLYLQKLAAGIYNSQVYPSLEEARKAVRLLLLDAEEIKNIRELKRIQDKVDKEIDAIYGAGWASASEELAAVALYEASWQVRAISQYSEKQLKDPTRKQVQSFIDSAVMSLTSGRRVNAGVWSDYVLANVDSTKRQVNGIVVNGYQRGQTVNQMNRAIKQSVEGILAQEAETLARTGMAHYANAARDAMAEANKDILKFRVFSATFDNRTTLQCFPHETEISAFGSIEKVFRSKYVGDTITIRTASGKELTGTPNHPILTSDGFLPLGEIDPSKHVVYTPLINDVTFPCVQDVGMKTTIGELFDSINKPSISNISRESSSAADFYGDGFGGDGEVDIASPKSELRCNIKTAFGKNIVDSKLGRVFYLSPLKSLSFFLKHLVCWSPVTKTSKVASSGLKVRVEERFRSSNFRNYFRWAKSCVKHFNSFFPISNDACVSDSPWEGFHDSESLKHGSNSGGACIILLSNFSSGKPIPVLIDNIVSVNRKFIDSHVYTLQSDNGIYTAGGIIVKNCRGNDGKKWAMDDDSYPRLPLHYGERSSYYFVTDESEIGQGKKAAVGGAEGGEDAYKGRRERQLDYAERNETTKPSKVKYRGKKDTDIFDPGPISAKTSQEAWLRKQPKWFVESALGDTRAKLFLDGKLPISKFTDMQGRTITLDRLRELDAEAFKRAGL